MAPNEAIAIVQSKAAGRTRYEGSEPYLDEVLAAEIMRLREVLNRIITECQTGSLICIYPRPDELSPIERIARAALEGNSDE